MNNKSLILALPLLALTGCNKLMPILPLGNSPTKAPSVPVKGLVLAMGQSNMGGKTVGLNPAEGFTKMTGIETINCAVGGTSIDQWTTDGPLDWNCQQLAKANGKKVIAVLWYQGEADAYLGRTNWAAMFTAMVTGWRLRYGSNVPIIYAQLATHDDALYPAPTWDYIKAAQALLYFPNSSMVKTDDLPRQDEVHLTGQADEEVGYRMARAYADLSKF